MPLTLIDEAITFERIDLAEGDFLSFESFKSVEVSVLLLFSNIIT